MPKMRHKADLPRKTCACCGREMVWRKAWVKTWEEVRYCSDKCRMMRKANQGEGKSPAAAAAARDK